MDKFDIFKFLTSAYSFYQRKNDKKEEQNGNNDFLEKLLSPIKNSQVSPTEKEEPEKPKKPLPLQEKMLSTMHSHDAFVNRVMKNNK